MLRAASLRISLATLVKPPLQRVVSFDRLGLLLYDAERGITRPQVLETANMVYDLRPAAVGDTPTAWVIESQQPLIIADTAAETRWPDTIMHIREAGIVSSCVLPLTTARTRVGAPASSRRHRGGRRHNAPRHRASAHLARAGRDKLSARRSQRRCGVFGDEAYHAIVPHAATRNRVASPVNPTRFDAARGQSRIVAFTRPAR